MRAAIFGEGRLEIKDVPKPSPGFEEALIKVSTAGVCHSDVHFVRGHWPRFNVPFPVPLGHEGIGIIEELGPGAEKYLSQGDRVIFDLGGSRDYSSRPKGPFYGLYNAFKCAPRYTACKQSRVERCTLSQPIYRIIGAFAGTPLA